MALLSRQMAEKRRSIQLIHTVWHMLCVLSLIVTVVIAVKWGETELFKGNVL